MKNLNNIRFSHKNIKSLNNNTKSQLGGSVPIIANEKINNNSLIGGSVVLKDTKK